MRGLARALQTLDFGVLAPLEWMARAGAAPSATGAAPIFLLAPPRSGSTFVYQLLLHAFDLGYLSNLHYLLYRYPFLGARIARRVTPPYVSDFRSDYGRTRGLGGPAEANGFWEFWLDQQLEERSPQPDEKRLRMFREYLGWRIAVEERPFLAGWIGHLLYPEALANAMPNAAYIHLSRNEEDLALSLYRSRLENQNSHWFSCLPDECREFEGAPAEIQAASQARALTFRADAAAARLQPRVVRLDYDSVCAAPAKAIETVARELEALGIHLHGRTDTVVPDSAAQPRRETPDRSLVRDALAMLPADWDVAS